MPSERCFLLSSSLLSCLCGSQLVRACWRAGQSWPAAPTPSPASLLQIPALASTAHGFSNTRTAPPYSSTATTQHDRSIARFSRPVRCWSVYWPGRGLFGHAQKLALRVCTVRTARVWLTPQRVLFFSFSSVRPQAVRQAKQVLRTKTCESNPALAGTRGPS